MSEKLKRLSIWMEKKIYATLIIGFITVFIPTASFYFTGIRDTLFPEDKEIELKTQSVSKLILIIKGNSISFKILFFNENNYLRTKHWLRSEGGLYETIGNTAGTFDLPLFFSNSKEFQEQVMRPKHMFAPILSPITILDTMQVRNDTILKIQFLTTAPNLGRPVNLENFYFQHMYTLGTPLFDDKLFELINDPYLPDSFKIGLMNLKSLRLDEMLSLRKAFRTVDSLPNYGLTLLTRTDTFFPDTLTPNTIVYTMADKNDVVGLVRFNNLLEEVNRMARNFMINRGVNVRNY